MNKSITAVIGLLGVGAGFLAGAFYTKGRKAHKPTPAQYKKQQLHQYLTTLEHQCELHLFPEGEDVVEKLSEARQRIKGLYTLSKPYLEN